MLDEKDLRLVPKPLDEQTTHMLDEADIQMLADVMQSVFERELFPLLDSLLSGQQAVLQALI